MLTRPNKRRLRTRRLCQGEDAHKFIKPVYLKELLIRDQQWQTPEQIITSLDKNNDPLFSQWNFPGDIFFSLESSQKKNNLTCLNKTFLPKMCEFVLLHFEPVLTQALTLSFNYWSTTRYYKFNKA